MPVIRDIQSSGVTPDSSALRGQAPGAGDSGSYGSLWEPIRAKIDADNSAVTAWPT
jgi:hypothetical protein